MSDIATIGFKVNTVGLEKANKALDKFSTIGEKLEKSIGTLTLKLTNDFKAISTAVNSGADSFLLFGNTTKEVRKTIFAFFVEIRKEVGKTNSGIKHLTLNMAALGKKTKASQSHILGLLSKVNESIKKSEASFKKLTASTKSLSTSSAKSIDTMGSSFSSADKQLNTTQKKMLMLNSAMKDFGTQSLKTDKKVTLAARHMHGGLSSILPMIKGIITMMGIMALLMLPAKIVEYADTWKGLSSQIRQVTKSEEDLITTREKILLLSRETRTSIKDTTNLFAELTRGTKELNISQDRIIGVVKTLNNLFVAGGKPISEVSGAIRQLNQGFASGVLRGDEFNSVAEGAPKVMSALTDSLKITRGQLREFAATGGITAKIMIDALESYKETAQKLADQTEKTFGQSMIAAQTNVIEFIGNSKSLTAVIGVLGSAIEGFTEILSPLGDALKASAITVSVLLVPSMIKSATVTATLIATTLLATPAVTGFSAAMGIQATSASLATIATNALGVATKFLLGPWGLMIAALSVAIPVFLSAKNKTGDLADETVKLKSKVNDVTSVYDRFLNKLSEIEKKSLSGFDINRLQEEFNKAKDLIDTYEKRLIKLQGVNASAGRQSSLILMIDKLKNRIKSITDILPSATKGYFNMSKSAKSLIDKLDPLQAITNKLKINQSLLNAEFEKGNISKKEQNRLLDILQNKYDSIVNKADPVVEAFNKQTLALVNQNLQLKLTSNEYDVFIAKQSAITNKFTPAMIRVIEDLTKANQKLEDSKNSKTKPIKSTKIKTSRILSSDQSMATLTKQVESFGGAWSRTGSIVVDAFGDISDSINDYVNQLNGLNLLQTKIDKERSKNGTDEIKLNKLQQTLNENKVIAELNGMKAISQAGQSLFSEKTAAAKAFAALTKIIAIAEIALSFKKIAAKTTETSVVVAENEVQQGSNALTAITSAFSAPFPVNFIAGASMIAIMATLLGSVFSGGNVKDPTGGRQKNQGTGTILGSSDKANSISESQSRFENIAVDQLSELRGIRDSIGSLSSGIEQLTKSFITGSIGDFKGVTGSTGGFLFGLFSKTTKSVIDNGIQFVSQSLGSIIDGGIVQAQAFFDIKTKKSSLFGIFKSESLSTETQGIDGAIKKQMSAIFTSIGNAVLRSAKSLGFETVNVIKTSFVAGGFGDLPEGIAKRFGLMFGQTTETVTLKLDEALSRFKVNIGKVSLEGLSGDEIQKELEAIFSKQADLIAKFLVPSIEKYQKVGEGLFDTLTRVALEQAVFNDQIDKIGFSLKALSNLMKIDVAQSIIDLSGGLDKFTSLTNSFFENFFSQGDQLTQLQTSLNGAFTSLGLSLSASRDDFKNLVQGIDLSTESGQKLFSALLALNPALNEFFNKIEDIEKKRTGLNIELLKLQGKAEKALYIERQIQLSGMDDSLVALQKLIFAEQDRIALLKQQQDAARSSFSMLEKSINLEKQRAQAVLDVAKTTLNTELSRIDTIKKQLNKEKQLRQERLSNAENELNKSFSKEIQRIKDKSNIDIQLVNKQASLEKTIIKSNSELRITSLGKEKQVLSKLSDSLRSLAENIGKAIGIGVSTIDQALKSAQSGDFSKAKSLNLDKLTNLDPAKFSSASDLLVQKAINENKLASISFLAKAKLSENEKLILSIKSQSIVIKNVSEQQIKAIDNNSREQVLKIQKIADSNVAMLENQLNSLLKIDTSILSVADAISEFKVASLMLDELNYDKQLTKLDLMITSANDVYLLQENSFKAESKRLDNILSTNEALLNEALGINTSILSVANAISALSDAILSINNNDKPKMFMPTPIFGFGGDIIPLPIVPPKIDVSSQQATNDATLEEIKLLREDNAAMQIEIVKNTKSTAIILQRFEIDGLDTRQIQ